MTDRKLPEWLWPEVAYSLGIAQANRPALEDCLPMSGKLSDLAEADEIRSNVVATGGIGGKRATVGPGISQEEFDAMVFDGHKPPYCDLIDSFRMGDRVVVYTIDGTWEGKQRTGPALPAEVHNPTKIDPDAAMAAVRSLCG